MSVGRIHVLADQLFEKLQLGRQTKGRAILYLFSPREKSLKIEVGYALEGVLPDIEVHHFETAAKSFIFVDRYQDFWAELINTMNIEISEKEKGIAAEGETFDFAKLSFSSGGAGILSHQYSATPAQLESEMKKLPPQKQSQFQPDAELKVSLESYLESLHQGIGDENLPILAAESRIFRQFTPQTTYQLFRNWKMMKRAGIDRILRSGDFTFVFFKPDHPVLPLVFRHESGMWKVHEPLSWSLFQRFEDSMQVFLKFPLQVEDNELKAYLTKTFSKPLYEGVVVNLDKLKNVDSVTDPVRYFFFNLYWLERVALELEKKKSLSQDADLLQLALDTYNNLGQFSKFLKIMDQLVDLRPRDPKLATNYIFYKETFNFSGPQWKLTFEGI